MEENTNDKAIRYSFSLPLVTYKTAKNSIKLHINVAKLVAAASVLFALALVL
jgi:hypothetical protein